MNPTQSQIAERVPADVDVSGGEPVVVMPGLNADVERLAAFRAALEPKYRCLVPQYLPWYLAMEHGGETLSSTIENVMQQIVPQLDVRPVTLVGYSFGGVIAHEVANRLAQCGIPIKVLAILDTDVTLRSEPPSHARLERRKRRAIVRDARAWGIHHAVALRVAHHLTYGTFRSTWLRRELARYRRSFGLPLPAPVSEAFDYRMSARIRELAARAWCPSTHRVPTVVFRCRNQPAPGPRDLGWSAYAPVVRVFDVGGTHNSMVIGTNGRRLAEALELALAALPDAP